MTTAEIEKLIAEGPFPTSHAAKVFTKSLRADRPVHPGTVARWIAKGHRLPDGRRVRLEGLRLGGKILTTMPAILRFLAAQQSSEDRDMSANRAPAARRSNAARTMAALTDAGAI